MIIPMLKRWMILTNGIWERGSESASFFLSILGITCRKKLTKAWKKSFSISLLYLYFSFGTIEKRTNVLKGNSYTDFPYRLLCAILCYGILNSIA